MKDTASITVGERYRRLHVPGREYVWVTGHESGSVGYCHPGGAASIPEAQFRRMFDHAPKRPRR
jgi:hypothetical protein